MPIKIWPSTINQHETFNKYKLPEGTKLRRKPKDSLINSATFDIVDIPPPSYEESFFNRKVIPGTVSVISGGKNNSKKIKKKH